MANVVGNEGYYGIDEAGSVRSLPGVLGSASWMLIFQATGIDADRSPIPVALDTRLLSEWDLISGCARLLDCDGLAFSRRRGTEKLHTRRDDFSPLPFAAIVLCFEFPRP